MDYLPLVPQYAVMCAVMGVIALMIYGPIAWTVGDAQRRGYSGGAVFLLVALFGPFAAFAWLVGRPRRLLVDRRPKEFSNPEDALAVASRLDQLGEWDCARIFYEDAARRWPEHHGYTSACLGYIESKRSLA